jgi:steroid 5-alpha reductase family enzyme
MRLLTGFRMTVLYLKGLAGIALSFSIVMGLAWMVQQRTGNSGWVETIWTFSVGAVGVGCVLWPITGDAIWPLRLGLPMARQTAGISEGVAT